MAGKPIKGKEFRDRRFSDYVMSGACAPLLPDGWRDEALCIGAVSRVFGTGRGMHRRKEVEEMRAVCERCPVRRECLVTGLEILTFAGAEGVYGVWGGIEMYTLWRALPRGTDDTVGPWLAAAEEALQCGAW